VIEHVFYYDGGMSSTSPTPPPPTGAGGVRGGLADPVAARAVAQLREAVDVLAARGWWQVSDGDLAAVVQASEVAGRRLQMVQVAAAVEAGKRGLPREGGFGPSAGVTGADTAAVANWLRDLVNLTPCQARHRARVGAALFTDPALSADLAQTHVAALAGQVSTAHVAVIADTIEKLSPPAMDVEDLDEDTRRDAVRFLTDNARVLDPAQTRVLATRTLAVLDPDAGERLARDEDARDQLRGLTLARQASGLVHLTGTLTPGCAGVLATAIDAASAPQPAADGSPDTRTPAMRRHDGLQHVLAQVVAADGLLPSTHGSPYRLVVTVPHATLTAELDRRAGAGRATGRGGWTTTATSSRSPETGSGRGSSRGSGAGASFGIDGPAASTGPAAVQPGLLPDGWPISPLTAQTLACSADLVPILVDDQHQPLDVGDTQYAFPPKIRTAIITRDKCCTYPGCGAPAPWCDAHHLIKFRHGGSTSVANGALLCARHHRYVHALHLTGRITDGRVQWDHRPTSWTATIATTARERQTSGTRPPGGRDGPAQTPPLTDRCLDELIRRWQRRRQARDQAA
jgi:hypothetical protein